MPAARYETLCLAEKARKTLRNPSILVPLDLKMLYEASFDLPEELAGELPDVGSYVSVIKLNGASILPPLMTSKRRAEMRALRDLAVKVEKHIQLKKSSLQASPDITPASPSFNNNLEVDFSPDTFAEKCSLKQCSISLENTSGDPDEVTSFSPNSHSEQNSIITTRITGNTSPDFDKKSSENEKRQFTPPNLVRSNSYTLETPSPSLLKFLKTRSLTTSIDSDTSRSGSAERKRKGWDLSRAKQKWSNMRKEANHGTRKPQRNGVFPNRSMDELGRSRRNRRKILPPEPLLSPQLSLKESPPTAASITPAADEAERQACAFVIGRMQMQQARLMNELLERQRREQESLLCLFGQQQAALMDRVLETSPGTPSTTFTITTTISEDTLADVRSEPLDLVNHQRNAQPSLPPCVDAQAASTSLEKAAASKIVAAARGYLVRRLLATDRVQAVIQTIKDSLLCAVQLHSEAQHLIEPSDVELHRRLIQQVTAACCEFHDIFFRFPRHEQLAMIAFDRERQREKVAKVLLPSPVLSATTIRVQQRRMESEPESPRAPFVRQCRSADPKVRLRSSDSCKSCPAPHQVNSVTLSPRDMSKKPWR